MDVWLLWDRSGDQQLLVGVFDSGLTAAMYANGLMKNQVGRGEWQWILGLDVVTMRGRIEWERVGPYFAERWGVRNGRDVGGLDFAVPMAVGRTG